MNFVFNPILKKKVLLSLQNNPTHSLWSCCFVPYNYGLCLKAARCGSREARGTWEAALYHRVPP